MAKMLSVRWDDFEAAFIIGAPGSRYFLNTRTGEVEYTSHLDDTTVRERVEKRTGGPDWVEIPRASTPEGLAEIQAFIESEDDEAFQQSLRDGLRERNPFMGFNRALAADPAARRRWAEHRMRGIHERLLEFCQRHDLDIDDDRYRALTEG